MIVDDKLLDSLSDDVVLRAKVRKFVEEERRSGSMEVVKPEYIYRMWGGKVELERIRSVMEGL